MENKRLIDYFIKKREDFPILKQIINKHKLIYADNGATTQKPKDVIGSIVDFYENYNSNIHRSSHSLAEKADFEFELARKKLARFFNSKENEVVFTKGATESLNKIAFGLADLINKDDEIVLTMTEHHANLVPWQEIAKKKGAILKFIPFNTDFELDITKAKKLITEKTKIVSIVHASNVFGSINSAKEIGRLAHLKNAIFILDAAQSAPHIKIDVKDIDCDFMAISAHKMCGPTGIGILYGKKEMLLKLKPLEFGGDMIDEVSFTCSTYASLPQRFEAGTPNIEGAIAFGTAVDYLDEIGMKNIEDYEKILSKHFLEKVKEVEELDLYGPITSKHRCAVFSFNIKGIHPHDLGSILDKYGIAARAGHHCVMPLHTLLNIPASCRLSFYFYNTIDEIDEIIEILKKAKKIHDKGGFLRG